MARKPKTPVGRIFAHLGSFWLAVVLLVNLFLLTWLGTLEQVDKGIHVVQREYFESWLVINRTYGVPFALPGGYVTMGLLVANLFVGGLVRIRKSRATFGVIVAHIGIALMMAGGLVEHVTSKYGNIALHVGESNDSYEEYAGWEVAIWDADQTSGIQEYLIPDEHFTDLEGDATRKFQRDELPFDIVLGRYMVNCRPERAVGVGRDGPSAPVIDGLYLKEWDRTKEDETNIGGIYVTALCDGGSRIERSFLFGREFFPWIVEADGKRWAMTLRHTRHPMPITIRLEKFIKDEHPGTSMARAYSSDVVWTDPNGQEHSKKIWMNHPLREHGLIVYQSGYGPPDGVPGEPYTILAVSENPSDRIPWVAVTIIGLGLLWTFLDRLLTHLARQRKRGKDGKVEAAKASTDARAAA